MMAFCEQNTSEGCLNQADEKDHKVFPVNEPSSMMHSVLETRNLWQQFDELGTEMIVTRRGRYDIIMSNTFITPLASSLSLSLILTSSILTCHLLCFVKETNYCYINTSSILDRY